MHLKAPVKRINFQMIYWDKISTKTSYPEVNTYGIEGYNG
jgi:hypothetical protein